MAATSIKLPDTLKRRIARIAAAVRQTPHAFMVEALTR
jgi:predicted transcriptional regulator